jgi:hypothetical protein
MRRLLTAIGFITVFATLALAENFSGRLLDASCTDQQKKETACQPTSTTTMFAIDIAGKVFMLDNSGNVKAVDALKNRADRSSDPNNLSKAAVVVKIAGTKDGDTIKVDTLEVQ